MGRTGIHVGEEVKLGCWGEWDGDERIGASWVEGGAEWGCGRVFWLALQPTLWPRILSDIILHSSSHDCKGWSQVEFKEHSCPDAFFYSY